jgi:hypothetical protein
MFLNHKTGGAGDAFGPRLLHPARLRRDGKIPLPFIFGQTHLGSDFHQSNENAIVIERVARAIWSGAFFDEPTSPRNSTVTLWPAVVCRTHAKESIRAAQTSA